MPRKYGLAVEPGFDSRVAKKWVEWPYALGTINHHPAVPGTEEDGEHE